MLALLLAVTVGIGCEAGAGPQGGGSPGPDLVGVDKPSANPKCECAPACKCVGGCKCGSVPKAETPAAPVVSLVVVGAEWCGPCRATHRNLAGAKGVRFLDFDKDAAEVRRLWNGFSPKVLPAYVLTRDDAPVFWWSGFIATPENAAAMLAYQPKPAAPRATAAPAQELHRHSHKCPNPACGFEWWHDERTATDPKAHNCPKCGAYQNVVNRWAEGAKP